METKEQHALNKYIHDQLWKMSIDEKNQLEVVTQDTRFINSYTIPKTNLLTTQELWGCALFL